MTTRRIEAKETFRDALARLDCPGLEERIAQLVLHLANRPHCAPSIDGSAFHVLHIGTYPEFPALRIYYRFDDETLYLLDVESWDQLAV